MNHLHISALKGFSNVAVSLYRLHVPIAFGMKAGFNLDVSHVFPHGVLAAITLVVGWAREGGATTGPGCETGLPLCSVAITALSRVGSDLNLLEQKP